MKRISSFGISKFNRNLGRDRYNDEIITKMNDEIQYLDISVDDIISIIERTDDYIIFYKEDR